MTSRERLLRAINRELPDCVPVAPDTSNMIPARLTGKPFWDLYLYKNPPIWLAYVECVKHFGFDSLMDGYVPVLFSELGEIDDSWEEFIVAESEERIVTQKRRKDTGKKESWQQTVTVYPRANPPTSGLNPELLRLPLIPTRYRPVEGRKTWPQGEAMLKLAKEELGDHGLVGVWCGTSKLVNSEAEIFDYHDNPGKYYEKRDRMLEHVEKRFHLLNSLNTKPDFLCTGGSGTFIHQTPDTFRKLALPIIQLVTRLAKAAGIPTHVHSCGPQAELVKILAEESDLTIIDPLEPSPMGDCDLAELKKSYGDKLILKGNLHTTSIMLHGTVEEVVEASKRAIDAAANGGGFILSSADQCGRDTPDENLMAMIETARTYGKY